MTAFDKATMRRVTHDWAALIPGFDIWKPMHLLRRIGPMLQGVALERSRSGAYYFATSHVHALTREFPVISLSLSHRVLRSSGQPEQIDASETQLSDVAARLIEQTDHSMRETPPAIADLIGAYHRAAVDRQRLGQPPAVMEMEDSILVAAFSERHDLVAVGLQLAEQLAAAWARPRLPLDWTTSTDWLDRLRTKAEDPSTLANTVTRQIAEHRLENVRAY